MKDFLLPTTRVKMAAVGVSIIKSVSLRFLMISFFKISSAFCVVDSATVTPIELVDFCDVGFTVVAFVVVVDGSTGRLFAWGWTGANWK